MVCTGNATEFCGGSNRLNVYNFTGTGLPPIAGGGAGTGAGSGSQTPPPTAEPAPVLSGLPVPWAYQACFVYVFSSHKSTWLTTGALVTLQMVASLNLVSQMMLTTLSNLALLLALARTLLLRAQNFLYVRILVLTLNLISSQDQCCKSSTYHQFSF